MKRFVKRLVKAVLPKSIYSSLRRHYESVRFRVHLWKRNIVVGVKSALSIPVKKRQERINFGFHITEHCNLNCASCNNFSPLAETEFIDVDEFTRDIERMGELFGHVCDRVRLLGGEPLLHPEIIRILETARRTFRTGAVRLLTNGTLLTRQSPEFWRACHDNRVTIAVTHYPIPIDTAKIRELAAEYDVELECSEEAVSVFFVEPVNLKGDGDCRKNFALCGRANTCPIIRHGRLFTCTFAPNVHNFSRKFGVDIPVSEADSIDIYDENMSSDEIFRRLIEPIPACRFCDMNSRPVKWHVSEGSISEWQ